jgi:hypothetical protein
MSRFVEYDDDGEENWALDRGRWERNSRAALKGRRGRQALRELREALTALPEHRLIEGAVCTVDAARRRAVLAEAARRQWETLDLRWRPAQPWTDEADELDRLVGRDGEGVCAVGALLWYRAVKAGMDPAEAFAGLPDVAGDGSDGLDETAELARQRAGLTYTLAWNLAFRNDETCRRMTPEERHAAFLAWIDQELAGAAP